MTEIQMDITACKGKFSCGMKDSTTHISTFKFQEKTFHQLVIKTPKQQEFT